MRSTSFVLVALLAASLALGGCRPSDEGSAQAVVIGDRLPRLGDASSGMLSPADLILTENAGQGLVRFDAAGNIAPGLAERWAVSDDGLSYVFRLQKAEWSDGRKLKARDVVRLLKRQLAAGSRNPLKDSIGAIRDIVAMTDRVIAIELSAPRPHLLQLLAQPEFGVVRDRKGTGPFKIEAPGERLTMTRTLPFTDDEEERRERVDLGVRKAPDAIAHFVAGKADVVLGGTTGDLPYAQRAKLPRNSLRYDPVAGLFGLLPGRKDGPAGKPEVRALLDEAIDRPALVAALNVPLLSSRTSLLQQGLDGVSSPFEPAWSATALSERAPTLLERARSLFPAAAGKDGEPEARPVISVAVPEGPGGAIILGRLQRDWGALGLDVRGAAKGSTPDFRWVDAVAPSTSPSWFLRSFRCEVVPVCVEEADQLLDAARLTGFVPQRNAFFADAERRMREAVLFMPVAAPIRWSLVSRNVTGFAENRFARHTLVGLRDAADARD